MAWHEKRKKNPKGKSVIFNHYFWKNMVEDKGIDAVTFRYGVEDVHKLLDERGLTMDAFLAEVRMLYGETENPDQLLIKEMVAILKESGVIGVNSLNVSLAGVNGVELSSKFIERAKTYEKK